MSFRRTDNIKVLLEKLGSLQITNKASEEYEQSDTEMLIVPAPTTNINKQAIMSKNIVLDLE